MDNKWWQSRDDGTCSWMTRGGLFWTFMLTLATVLWLMVCSASMAATTLSDSELAGVSGAGMNVTPDNQNLPEQQQQVQQPTQNGAGYTPSQSAPQPEGMELAPQVFTVLQSNANVQRDRTLRLDGEVQRGARSLNMENSLSSDSIAANNVFNGGALTTDDVTTVVEVNQLNDLQQMHRSRGALQSSLVGYHYESFLYRVNGSDSYDQQISFSIDQRDRHSIVRLIEKDWNIAVEPINFAESFSEGNSVITFYEAPQVFLINPVGAGFTVSGLFGDKYGAEAFYSGLFVQGPTASVNDIVPTGPNGQDLLIDSTLRLGLIDFGHFKITACLGGCATTDTDLGELEVLNFYDFLATVDPIIAPNDGVGFSSDGIILEGMGSVFNDYLNLNTGFAFVGSGSVTVTEPASFHSGGEFTFNVDAGVTLNLDLSGIDVLNLFDPWPKQWSIPDEDVDLIDLAIPFTLIDIESGVIDRSFAGVLVIPLGPGAVTADSKTQDGAGQSESDTQTLAEEFIADVSDSSFSEFYEHAYMVGGQMSGAEAELLSLSAGTLSVSNINSILLTESAQRNISVLNGVNAVSSVAANAVNISRPPVLSGGGSAVKQMSLRQHNRFTQQR